MKQARIPAWQVQEAMIRLAPRYAHRDSDVATSHGYRLCQSERDCHALRARNDGAGAQARNDGAGAQARNDG
ncbi:MAG: hypothetical protein WD672_07640, partial [Woeseia sp.]